jgi:hypothetical protein
MRAIAQAAAAAAAAPAVRTVGTSRGRSGGCSCGKAHRTHAARTQALSRTCNAGRGAGAQEGILDHVRTRLQTNLGTAHSCDHARHRHRGITHTGAHAANAHLGLHWST